jgi:hypothetical protein
MLRSPYIELHGTHAEYRARLKRSFRAGPRRRHRRLTVSGEVTIDLADGSGALDALLAAHCSASSPIASWTFSTFCARPAHV